MSTTPTILITNIEEAAVLEVVGLTKTFPSAAGPVRVLDGIDLRLEPGQRVTVMGPSGSGKSTLLAILGTLDEPTSGVDVRTRHDVMHLIHELHHEGLAIVLTTHDLNGIAAHLPSLVCLNRRVVASGRPRDVLTPAVLEQTYGAPLEVLVHGGMPVVLERYDDEGAAVAVAPEGHHAHPA